MLQQVTSVAKIIATLPVAIAGFLVLSLDHDKSDDPQVIVKTGTPVLLLHGSNANQKQWFFFRKHLDKHIPGHVFALNMNRAVRCDDHNRDILDYSSSVHEKILDMKQRYADAGLVMDKVILVGNSMGGLVAGGYCISNYVQDAGIDISALITISTPWGGTHWADRFCSKDIYPEKYFCTDSEDRQRLVEKVLQWHNDEKIPVYNYGSKFDLLVPLSSSHLPLPEEQLWKDNRNDHWTTMLDKMLPEEIGKRWILPHSSSLYTH